MKLAVGFFDGVHRGHQAILSTSDAALTFRNHPLSLLSPTRAPSLILSPREREDEIRKCGVKEVIMLEFTNELASLSPEEFFDFVKTKIGADEIRCGENWRFGKDGKGDANFLKRRNFPVSVVEAVTYKNEIVSSTRIRASIFQGDFESASKMLGKNLTLCGERVQGKGVGKKMLYPTLNIKLWREDLGELLPRGVYHVSVDGVFAIANYGVAPTFLNDAWKAPLVEIHFHDKIIPNFEKENFQISFHRFLRPEKKFDSLEELKAQIARDIASL